MSFEDVLTNFTVVLVVFSYCFFFFVFAFYFLSVRMPLPLIFVIVWPKLCIYLKKRLGCRAHLQTRQVANRSVPIQSMLVNKTKTNNQTIERAFYNSFRQAQKVQHFVTTDSMNKKFMIFQNDANSFLLLYPWLVFFPLLSSLAPTLSLSVSVHILKFTFISPSVHFDGFYQRPYTKQKPTKTPNKEEK